MTLVLVLTLRKHNCIVSQLYNNEIHFSETNVIHPHVEILIIINTQTNLVS